MNFLKKFLNYFLNVTRVLMEVSTESEKRRYVVTSGEWASIKEWYYDNNNRDDYLITLDESEESYTLVRLNKGATEIKVWEINRLNVLFKNLWNILKSPVPRIIRFTTAFFLAFLVWPVIVPISFIMHQQLTPSALDLAINLTSVIFLVFMLFNVIYFIFKAVDSLVSKYKAFLKHEEPFVMDTLLFNAALLLLFTVLGGEKLVQAAVNLWEYANKFM
ncbi:MAG: hypothetical protein PHX37_00475 [Eubacteriales bacterium]|nr:hypothetical protein [Eubacteriales bacterium]